MKRQVTSWLEMFWNFKCINWAQLQIMKTSALPDGLLSHLLWWTFKTSQIFWIWLFCGGMILEKYNYIVDFKLNTVWDSTSFAHRGRYINLVSYILLFRLYEPVIISGGFLETKALLMSIWVVYHQLHFRCYNFFSETRLRKIGWLNSLSYNFFSEKKQKHMFIVGSNPKTSSSNHSKVDVNAYEAYTTIRCSISKPCEMAWFVYCIHILDWIRMRHADKLWRIWAKIQPFNWDEIAMHHL